MHESCARLRLHLFLRAVWCAALLIAAHAGAQDFSGYTLKVKLLGDGLSEALYAAVIPAWEARTGAKVQILSKKEIYLLDQEIKRDIAQRTVTYCLASNHTSFGPQYGDLYRDLAPLLPASHLAHFDPHVLELAKINGVLVQLPRYSDISQIFYNKALYDSPGNRERYRARFGKELTPPTSWSEYARQAQFFTVPPSQYGTLIAGKNEPLTGRFYEMLVAEGGQLFDKDWRPAFNSPAGLRALNFFVELYQSGAAGGTLADNGWDETARAFASGRVALDLDWGGWAHYFNDPNTSRIANQVGVVRAPRGSSGKRTGWSGSHTFSITRSCDNPAAAADFLLALTSMQSQLIEARQGKVVARPDAAALALAEFRRKGDRYMSDVLETFTAAMTSDAFTPPLTPEWLAVADAMAPTLRAAILGRLPPRGAREQAQKLVTGIMRDAGRLHAAAH